MDSIIRAERLSSGVLSPRAGREPHALLLRAHTPRGPGSKQRRECMDERIDGLPISPSSSSSSSPAPVCSIIQAGLNPSSLHPPILSLSIRPSFFPLSHINRLSLTLLPSSFHDRSLTYCLSCFFPPSTLILPPPMFPYSPDVVFGSFLMLMTRHYWRRT